MFRPQFKEFAKLERKARREIKTSPEARAIDRKAAGVDRQLASGKIAKSHATVLKQLLRNRRNILVLRWLYAFLRAELPQAAK